LSHSFRDLVAWQRGRILAVDVYNVTAAFPRTEMFGLANQMRRAAVSIASNIAEGQGRLTKGEFLQFLGHARGSLLELETQIEIAADLQYLNPGSREKLLSQVALVLKPLNGLMSSMRRAKLES